MIRLSILLFASTLLLDSSIASADQRIVPGIRIGEIKIGDSQKRVRGLLGKPGRSFVTHDGRSGDRWQHERFEVVYKAGKVVQIQTFIPGYKTAKGVSTASTLATVKRLYPGLKSTTYFFDEENGEGLTYYDDIQAGITFVVPVPWKESAKPEQPWIVLVHAAKQEAIPTLIKDASNRLPEKPNSSPR